ncbi:MAG: hypothetical protein GX228_06880 [Firmicutes bacterium]|jgi:spore coat assembly protein|nr:sporulation peptidase YabG [Bacillota bacterium]NLL88636.1 hypothetical protein [Bacillota bacterium]HKM16959.1 sporulation peptidase YabG [Limnochordia bacterium]
MDVAKGSIVVRRSYSGDIYFIVAEIHDNVALLKGLFHRLQADAPLDDLIKVSDAKEQWLLERIGYAKQD